MPRRDDIRRLHEQRAHIHAEMRSLSETAEKDNRDLNAEESGQFDKMATEFEELEARARRAEALFAQERQVDQMLTTPLEKRVAGLDGAPETYREFRDQRTGPAVQEQAEYRNAFWQYISTRSISDLDVEEHRALSKGTTTAGGFLVPTDFYNQIIRSLRFMGTMASLATEITTDNGDTIQVPANTAHGTAAWLAEAGSYTPSDETFAQVNLSAFKASTKIIVSEELLQDSAFDLDSFLAREFGERIGVLENTAYIQGSGTGQPQGLLSSATASNITTVTAAAGAGNTTTFTYSALVSAIFSLPKQYRDNASFIVNDQSARNLYLMLDTQNRPLWSVNVAVNGPDTFLGYPIYTDPDVPTPAIGNISVLFGDWRRTYMVRRVTGFGIQRQNELHSDSGQVGFRGFERVDGRVVLAAAGIALKHPAT
jgi:HK97 family phage major capsid protein